MVRWNTRYRLQCIWNWLEKVWPPPPENLRSRRLHCSVSHQTHNKGGLQKISVHTIQNCKTSFHRNHLKPKRSMRHEYRPLVCPLLQVTNEICGLVEIRVGSWFDSNKKTGARRGTNSNVRNSSWASTWNLLVHCSREEKQNCVGCFFAPVRSSASLAAVSVDTKIATRHIGARLAMSK